MKPEQITETLEQAAAQLDTDAIFLPPEIRDALAAARSARRASAPATPPAP